MTEMSPTVGQDLERAVQEVEAELEGAGPRALRQRQDLPAEVGLRGVRRRPRRRRPPLRLGSGEFESAVSARSKYYS